MKSDVVIIGGGLSGLAAAVDLASRGARVALFERSPKLGGRCYSTIDKKTGDVVDNGQHVLLGAYRHTLQYLETIGTRSFLKHEPALSLLFHHPDKGIVALKVGSLPRPFHLTAGMLQFKALSLKERRQLLNVGVALTRWNQNREKELSLLTVRQWLQQLHQSEAAMNALWSPLAVSIMNEQPDRASAVLLARSLRAAFLGTKSDSAVLLPTVGQTELYVNGAVELLKRSKAHVCVNAAVGSIDIARGVMKGVTLKDGTHHAADAVISAVPHFGLRGIVPEQWRSELPFANGSRFESSPIISFHLWYDANVPEFDFIGLIGGRVQWLFNKRRIMGGGQNRPAYLSAVISGAHEFIDLSAQNLVSIAVEDVRRVIPSCNPAALVHSVVIKEKRATFSPTNEVESLRPSTETPVKGLYLAGDWTNTGLPATIEGAVMSGVHAAQCALR